MKKTMLAVLTMILVFAVATACAAVSSKTTTDNTYVWEVKAADGAVVAEDLVIEVAEDKAPVVEEITNLYKFVNEEQSAPVEYFPIAVQQQVIQMLPEVADIATLECNEFVTINETGYQAGYGDVVARFQFVTKYKPGQKMVALVGVYTGEKNAAGEYIVEWIPLEAVAQEDGTVAVTLTEDVMLKFGGAETVAMTILSEAQQ